MIRSILPALPLVLLAACNVSEETDTGTMNTATAEAPASNPAAGGVMRETSTPASTPAPTPAPAAAIASQPGPGGSTVDLLGVKVTGDVLTVSLRCSSADRINTESFNVEQISVIDDATAQRLGVLKDDDGNWLSSNTNGNFMSVGCEAKPGVMWAKFPAPPAPSQTVSINLPEVLPFDGVQVSR